LISAGKESRIFNFFSINLETIRKKNSFISNFSNLIRNLGRKGLLIFHFRMDHHENIKLTSYFVEKCETNGKSSNMEEIINNFFHCNLIKRQEIKIKVIFNLIWRLGITSHYFFFIDFEVLFHNKKLSCSLNLLEMNELFERNLLNSQIEYVKLSKNLYFVDQSYLFLILQDLDSNYIYEIIEKYYPKYFIYILILNYLGYEKLLEIESIKLIENIKIINPVKIQKFSYEIFKKNS